MIVTINTDASFYKKQQRGSYAFAIVSNRGRIYRSGVLRKKVTRPEIAEFKCILNAIHVLIQQDWPDISLVVVNTDCLNVIHLLENKKDKIAKYKLGSWGRPLVLKYRIMVAESKKLRFNTFSFRHVKSHTTITDARSYVNDWCDREAKKVLENYIKQKK